MSFDQYFIKELQGVAFRSGAVSVCFYGMCHLSDVMTHSRKIENL